MARWVNRYSQTTRDANEPALLALARQLGCHWWEGPPLDGWTLSHGVWIPTEIKTGAREGWESEYTPNQKAFLAFARLHGGPVQTWRYDEDVFKALDAKRTA